MRSLENDEIQIFTRQRDLLRKNTNNPEALLRVAIYARKSTEDKSETSIPSQKTECKKFVSKYPELFSNQFNHIYVDENISGLTYNRKGLQQMLDAAKLKEFDVVMVYHHDRLTRDGAHFKQIDEVLRKNHIEILFGNMYCKRDAMGQYITRLFYSNAEFEVEISAERTATVLRNNANSGRSAGGSAPYGMKYVGKQFDINEEEARAVRLMFRLAANGASYSTIREELSAQGYKTRRGQDFSNSTISGILQNRKYRGEYVYCIKGKDGHQKNIKNHRVLKYEQEEIVNKTAILHTLIPQRLFDEVQSIVDSHKGGTPKQDAHSEYILSGLIKCKCGSNVCGETTSKNGKRYRYYVCQEQRKKKDCQVKKIKADHLENVIKLIVIKECKALLASGLIKKEAFDSCASSLKTAIENLSKLITQTGKQNKNLIDKLSRVSKEVADLILNEIESNLKTSKTNEHRLETLKKRQDCLQRLSNSTTIEDIDFDFEKLFADNKRARKLIRLFVKRIILDNDKITIELY